MNENKGDVGSHPKASQNEGIPFDLRKVPKAAEPPKELFEYVTQVREWKDKSANSMVLVG